MNNAQVIYEKKEAVGPMSTKEGFRLRRRSIEVSDDEATISMRAATLQDDKG